MPICPIWRTDADEAAVSGDYRRLNSPRVGGTYTITRNAELELRRLSERQLAALTTWIVNQHRAGVSCPVVTSEVIARVEKQAQLSFSLRVSRFFDAIMDEVQMVGRPLDLYRNDKENNLLCKLTAWMECIDPNETQGMFDVLATENYLEPKRLPKQLLLTGKGYQRLDALRAPGLGSNRVFVAMWYDPSIQLVYDPGFSDGILDAGYDPVHLDRAHYLDSVNDRIVSEIRRAHFIVADFTCRLINDGPVILPVSRGNVYFEAGFAIGIGVPVIWTCRSDCIKHVHFDTMQYPHLVWDAAEDLRIKLRDRIVSVFGATDKARIPYASVV